MILYCTVICIVLKKKKSFLEFAVEEDYVGRGTCRLSIARHEFFKVNFAFALPKGSRMNRFLDKKWYAQQPIQPSNNDTYYLIHNYYSWLIRRIYNIRIMRMIETGLFVYWKRRYWPPSADKCSVVGGNHPSGGPPIKGPRRFARRPSGRIRICVSHLPYRIGIRFHCIVSLFQWANLIRRRCRFRLCIPYIT